MCGIFGILSPGGEVTQDLVGQALALIARRGPDDEGVYVSPSGRAGLGHRRLSILDLSPLGHQPMADPSGRYRIVFNGEIYNFQEIRRSLEAEGEVFRSSSDTEVLLAAYVRHGRKALDRLNGMFAFGIYDALEERLFLARDRAGKKPLFYAARNGAFVFASELKQILSAGITPREISLPALNQYMSLGYAAGELSLAEGVRKLPACDALEFDLRTGRLEAGPYWDLPPQGAPVSEAEALEYLEGALLDAVRMRLVSDVPLGAFLSGGVDSSLVVALMRRVHSGTIRTFSVGFEGIADDERRYAAIVARALQTDHTEIVVTPRVDDDLEHISSLLDEPIYDNSLLPTYYLSRETRRHVTVAISGDGGDELFGGYIHYHSAATARRFARLAFPPLKGIAGLASSAMPEGFFGKNTLAGIARGQDACFTYPTQIFKPEQRQRLFTRDVLRAMDLAAPTAYRESMMGKGGDFVTRMCRADFKTSLVDDILVKVDRASMMNSLEVRCPLLDYRIVEYAFGRVPGSLKLRGGIKKYILKRLAARHLPAELDIERKKGFDIPGALLRKTRIAERLMDFPAQPYVNRDYIQGLAEAQRSGRAYLWHKLFGLYFFLRWWETWIKK